MTFMMTCVDILVLVEGGGRSSGWLYKKTLTIVVCRTLVTGWAWIKNLIRVDPLLKFFLGGAQENQKV